MANPEILPRRYVLPTGALAGLAAFGALACSPADPYAEEEHGQTAQAVSCDPNLASYPVRGNHNNGYDPNAGNSSLWACNDENSNTDYYSAHLGNDIWAAEGTPVVATTSGTLTLTGWSDYSGNKVTIADNCGWHHFYCHLQSIAPGIQNGVQVTPGQLLGYVGKTGTASNGVVHLHYSIYPAGNYDAGVDPWPYLHAVEKNVCCAAGPPVCDDNCEQIPAAGATVEEDGGCFEAHGPSQYWRREQGVGNGDALMWTDAWENGTPANWGRWNFDLEQAGDYSVEAYVDPAFGVYSATRYRVRSSGNETDVIVNQSTETGWVKLGEFSFAAGSDQWLDVYDNYSGTVPDDQHIVADAVRLGPVTPATGAGGMGAAGQPGAGGDSGGWGSAGQAGSTWGGSGGQAGDDNAVTEIHDRDASCSMALRSTRESGWSVGLLMLGWILRRRRRPLTQAT